MRIVVFGATGRTGSTVAEQALGRGHEVTAFVRTPARLTVAGDGLTVVTGDALKPEDVLAAVGGQDAVISALGARTDGLTDLTETTANVIAAAEDEQILRVAIVVNMSVFFTKISPEYAAIRDIHLANVEALRACSLDWTAMASATIEDRAGAGRYDAVIDGKPPERQISRYDLADSLLDALDTPDWIGHVVGVSGP